MQNIIEIEYTLDALGSARVTGDFFGVLTEICGQHPDGLVTVRYTGEQENLERLVERVKPDDEFEAYMIV
jgi:hypothetical protein